MDKFGAVPNRSAAAQRVSLRNLDLCSTNIFIVGVIIAKQKIRTFTSNAKSEEASGMSRAVWNFTLRDSINDYINCTVWGINERIQTLAGRYRIGDVVDIVNPRVSLRQASDYGERFRPMVTSPFMLTLNEKSEIFMHQGDAEVLSKYQAFMHYPTKPVVGFVVLRDILHNGNSLQEVDILVSVRRLFPPRNINFRDGLGGQVRDVEVFDHTAPSFRLSLWSEDWIARSNYWQSRTTILFITDLTVSWNSFSRQFSANISGKTIITENPRCPQASTLMEFAKTAPIETSDILDQMTNTTIKDVETIQDVMSIKQVQDKLNTLSSNGQFFALVYASVTSFDLDGYFSVLQVKCGWCKALLQTKNECQNFDCVERGCNNEYFYNIRLNISDHTGTLVDCRMNKHAVELALGCNAEKFALLSSAEKDQLKWRYLLECCAIRLAVIIFNDSPVVSIVDLKLADRFEVSQKMPTY